MFETPYRGTVRLTEEAGMGMRRTVGLGMMVLALVAASAVHAASDEFGYRSIASTQPGGPVVDTFHGINGTGTHLSFVSALDLVTPNADDGAATNLSLAALNGGAGFPYYGRFRTAAHMTTNGFLGFELSVNLGSLANQCPLSEFIAPNDGIAVLWDDLVLANPPDDTRGGYVQSFASCPYAQGGTGACVVFEWYRVRRFAGPGTEAFTLQAVLYESGNVLLIYRDDNPGHGSSSTTGLDGPIGTLGITHACNTADSIPNDSAVLFIAPKDSRVGVGEVEPNDDQPSATALPAGSCGAGAVPSPDAIDVWRISGTSPNDRLWAMVDAPMLSDPALAATVGAGESVIGSDDQSGPEGDPVIAGVPLALGGDVFLRVTPSLMGGSVAPYSLMAYVAQPGDIGPEVEPNDNVLEARPITAPVMAGDLSPSELDHYSIDAVAGDVLAVMVDADPDDDGENTRLDIVILGPDLLSSIGGSDFSTDRAAVSAGRAVVAQSGKQVIRVRRTSSQKDSSYQMAVLRNCAPACADADADGACDALDNCAGVANDQADGDGDGVGDACDGCAADAAKTAAGTCGCGIADADANANGVVDCLANAELRTRLDGLRTAVAALTKTRKKKPNPTADAVRARLDDVVAYLRSGPAGLVLLSGDPNGMADQLSTVVGKALKGAAKFGKKKKKATAAVQAALDAVAP
jgi:hypothetical protein